MLFPGHAKSLGIREPFSASSSTFLEAKQAPRSSTGDKEWRELETGKPDWHGEEHIQSTVVDDQGTPASRTLWIGGVPISITGVTLKQTFALYGTVESTNPMGDNFSRLGFAYVNFKSIDSAVRARKQLNGKRIFENSGVPVVIRFDRNSRENLDLQKPTHDYPELARATAARERNNEWLRPRSRDRSDPESSHRISAEQLNELLPKRASLRDRVEWPNGPPPTGPKARPANISPPPLRHTNSYRTEQEYRRGDSYRPGLDHSSRERRHSEQEEFRNSEQRSWRGEIERPSTRPHPQSDHSAVIDHKRNCGRVQARHSTGSLQSILESRCQDETESAALDTAPRLQRNGDESSEVRQGRDEGRSSPQNSSKQLHLEQNGLPPLMIPPTETSHPTLNSPVESVSMEEDSDDTTYSPRYNPSSPKNLVDKNLSTEEGGQAASSWHIQVDGVAELPQSTLGKLSANLASGTTKVKLTPGPLHLRRHLGLNDETCSLASERTASDRSNKTGVSNASSLAKTCFDCHKKPTTLTPIFKCLSCSRRYHRNCWVPPSSFE
jgi:RNA recognition motif. (a.k.a. RRM, RBD, or RNP domain)